MATRLKKLLHHKKDNEDTPDSPTSPSPTQDKTHHRRLSRSDKTNPALRPSMDGTGAAEDGSSGFTGRQSGTYSRGGPPQIGDLGFASSSAGHEDGPLPSEFSRLNLDRTRGESERSASFSCGSTDTDLAAGYQPDSVQTQHYGDSPSRRAGGIRRVDTDDQMLPPSGSRSDLDEGRHHYPTGSTSNTHDPAYGQHQSDGLARPASIPRKEVGSRTTPPGTTSSHIRQSSLQKPLPTTPHGTQGSSIRDSPGISGPTHATAGSPGTGGTLTAEEVLRRAQGSSRDTTVIEKIAPGQYPNHVYSSTLANHPTLKPSSTKPSTKKSTTSAAKSSRAKSTTTTTTTASYPSSTSRSSRPATSFPLKAAASSRSAPMKCPGVVRIGLSPRRPPRSPPANRFRRSQMSFRRGSLGRRRGTRRGI